MFFSSLDGEGSWKSILRLFLERDHGYLMADASSLVLAFVCAITGYHWSFVGSLSHPLKKDTPMTSTSHFTPSRHPTFHNVAKYCRLQICWAKFISILGLTRPMDCKLDIPITVCLLK